MEYSPVYFSHAVSGYKASPLSFFPAGLPILQGLWNQKRRCSLTLQAWLYLPCL